jgi:hypothetical protein
MKKVIMLSAVAFALTIIACNNSETKTETSSSAAKDTTKTVAPNNLDTTKLASGTTFYQCPMHPEELSATPASCSKCGMDLEKVVKK